MNRKLRPHQIQALDAIKSALNRGQRCVVVQMPVGCGMTHVLVKTAEILDEFKLGKTLIITSRAEIKELVKQNLFENSQETIRVDKSGIVVETEHKILNQLNEIMRGYSVVIFFDAIATEDLYAQTEIADKTIIVFSKIKIKEPKRPFSSKDVVFSYSYKEAIRDGYITPAMNIDVEVFGVAVVAFCEQLLKQWEYTPVEEYPDERNRHEWDLLVQRQNKKIYVECKAYKNPTVSPSIAQSLLSNVVMKKAMENIQKEDCILLVVLSKIPSFQKDEIYKRYNIIVWDIENLVFYSKSSSVLLKQLAQVTYFPIDYIEGEVSLEAESAGLPLDSSKSEFVQETKNEEENIAELIQRLKECRPGIRHSGEYERICEDIIRALFEANYFNSLTNQNKTRDKHFRMDLIGSLKIYPNNEKSLHPLWQMLVQHFNSHFIVFEFKNYAMKIDQNLIYITEKYLFDSTLRNVAVIISRKGFSKAAQFAAEGCLKEHGKLILDICDEDLEEMLKQKSDNAADYLLDKLERFLMGISK